ncbi:MAG: hypothetical protein HYS43_00605 [Candidatus Liptonbacteria bacterium]|nr:hypothetical protein [Candidatus Liptonbacteria bacterium]
MTGLDLVLISFVVSAVIGVVRSAGNKPTETREVVPSDNDRIAPNLRRIPPMDTNLYPLQYMPPAYLQPEDPDTALARIVQSEVAAKVLVERTRQHADVARWKETACILNSAAAVRFVETNPGEPVTVEFADEEMEHGFFGPRVVRSRRSAVRIRKGK